jgi:hypothetical protein
MRSAISEDWDCAHAIYLHVCQSEYQPTARGDFSKIENGATGVSFGNVLSVLRALGLLDKVESITDPYEHDLGRARADQMLPKRVRR